MSHGAARNDKNGDTFSSFRSVRLISSGEVGAPPSSINRRFSHPKCESCRPPLCTKVDVK